MTQATPSHHSISLREYIEKTVQLRFDKLEVTIDLRFEALKRALELQAVEYERRLTALNHEAEQLKRMQSTYALGSLVNQRLDEIDNKINDLKLFRAELAGKASMPAVILSWVLGGLSVVLSIVALIDKIGP